MATPNTRDVQDVLAAARRVVELAPMAHGVADLALALEAMDGDAAPIASVARHQSRTNG